MRKIQIVVFLGTPKNPNRKLTRKISFKTAANIANWSARARLKQRSMSNPDEPIDLKIDAKLESVMFKLMTSRVNLATIRVRDLESSWTQKKSVKELTAKLVDFEIFDLTEKMTRYRKIAKSEDDKVFDAKISMYDLEPSNKATNPDLVDIEIEASMGRIKLVFVMKFVNDILTFIEPFSDAKEIVVEKAANAREATTKTMLEAYTSQTRARLNIKMDAPLIIIPISSKNTTTLYADLGKLHLSNRFEFDAKHSRGTLMDSMQLDLKVHFFSKVKLSLEISTKFEFSAKN